MTLTHVVLWFMALSLLAFCLMWFDKRAAKNDGWRVPERTLLLWAFLGGAAGAKLAQQRFRHKTRKQPFAALLNAAVAINAAIAVLLQITSVRQTVFDILLDVI